MADATKYRALQDIAVVIQNWQDSAISETAALFKIARIMARLK